MEKKRSPKRLFVGTVCTCTLSVCCRMGSRRNHKQFCTPSDPHRETMRTKTRAQRPSTLRWFTTSTETKRHTEVEPDTDSEDSMDRDEVISVQEARAATTAAETTGTAEPRTSLSWTQLVLVALSFHPLSPVPHIACPSTVQHLASLG